MDLNLLLKAYRVGIFPMADARDDPDTFWVEPKMRAIMPLETFHISRSLRKTIRSDRFRVTANKAFEQVIATCAETADDRDETWINAEIEAAFLALHKKGFAHSVECWLTDPQTGKEELAGGLYGLEIGRAFCGESMFSRASDASKVAMAWLVARLRVGGFSLLDCQFMTDHLRSLGAIEISQKEYLARLELAQDFYSAAESAGAAGRGAGAGAGASGAGVLAASPPAPSFGALEVFLSELTVAATRGAVGFPSSDDSSSPGKLISHFLTQTS